MDTANTTKARMSNADKKEDTTKVEEKDAPKTLLGKSLNVFRNITVEPTAFLLLFSGVYATITTQTLVLEKACRVSLQLGDEICDSLRLQNVSNNFSHFEQMVQEHVAPQLIWKSAIESALPCILLLFVGAWSDKTGKRKIIMFVPIAGEILLCCSNIINIIFFYEIPLEVLIFFDSFFKSITGSYSVMFVALFSYIANTTSIESRTHRLGLVNLAVFAGTPLGLAFSGVILQRFGYLAVYGSALVFHIINVIYTFIRVNDPPRSEDQLSHDNRGFVYFIKTFFDVTTIKTTLQVVFKKAPHNRRCRLLILLGTIVIIYGPVYGEAAVLYLITRFRFNWDELMYSIYQTYSFALNGVGLLFTIFVLSKYLKWHDSILGLLSSSFKIAASFVYAFAPTPTIFFLASVVDLINGAAILAVRSIYSKLVEPNELGKMNSLVGLTETLLPVIYVSLYTQVYTNTMTVLPGAVYLLGAAMNVPAVGVFIWLFFEHRKDKRRVEAEKGNIESTHI